MWKPRVLRSRFTAHLGGGSAQFAGAILARRAPAPDSGLYPEAWLVFREEEERAAEQSESQIHLTQLTVRLALQLSEYFSAPVRQERTVMELASLRQTLRTCLTALETRDRETCREVRTLLELSREQKGEETPAPAAVRERETLRERLTERLTRLELRELSGAGESRIISQPARMFQPGARPEAEAGSKPGARGRTALPGKPPAASPPVSLWRRAASHTPEAMTVSGRTAALQVKRTETALLEHKSRFLELFSRVDEGEQTALWRTVEERVLLTTERRRQWSEEYHLTAREKMERLVRESTRREYTDLLETLQRQLAAGPAEHTAEEAAPARSPAREERTFPAAAQAGTAPAPGAEGQGESLAREAAPLVDWLSQTLRQGRVRRKTMVERLQAAPEAAQRAFLALALESGAFHSVKGETDRERQEREKLPPMETLTLLTRESRRQELEHLVRYVGERQERAAHETPSAPGAGEHRQFIPAPGEKTAAAELRRFLLPTRGTDREIIRILSEIRPGEREVLYRSLGELTGVESAPKAAGTPARQGEILQLLERSGDPARLLERVRTTETFRAAETRRLQERTVLERLRTFSRHREEAREKETVQLIRDLDRQQQTLLLGHLQTIREVPLPAGQTAAEGPERLLREVLTFATQKEYRTFQQRLTRYLERQTDLSRPVLAPVLRWAEDRRRWEALERAEPALPAAAAERIIRQGLTPAATVLREFRRETVLSPGPAARRISSLPPAAPSRPPAGQRPAAPISPVRRTAEAMAPVWRQPKQGREPSGEETTAPRSQAQSVLLQTTIQRPGRDTREETRTLRERALLLKETAPQAPVLPAKRGETPPLTLRQEGGVPRQEPSWTPPGSSNTLLPAGERTVTWRRAEPAAAPARAPQKAGRQEPPAPPTLRHRAAPAEESREPAPPAPPLQREAEGSPTVLRQRDTLQRETERKEVRTEKVWRDIALLTQVRLEKRPVEIGRRPPPIRTAVPPAEQQMRTVAVLRQSGEPSAPAGRRKPPSRSAPAPARAERQTARSAPAGRTVQMLSPADRAPEPPELELRRDRTQETARRQTEQAVEERVELAMERQAPQLNLLRRQSQEQERVLEQQRKDLSGMKERLERQEAQVRQMAAQARIPTVEEPAQVRRLAKAVMKELEGQLRLERQRRGLS